MSKKSKQLKKDVSAYMNTVMKLNLEVDHLGSELPSTIRKRFDLDVFTGQKRIVIEAGDEVMKLVYSPDGLQDNINEVLTSHRLKELAADKKKKGIDEDDLELFALAEPYEKDPYIIVAPKHTRIIESSEFNEWYKENKNEPEYKDLTKNAMVGYFIMTNKKYNDQQKKITNIISKYFAGSDLYAFKVPENYLLSDDDNLVLCDMGSILPKYKGVDITCEICGRQKRLMVPTAGYKKMDEIDTLMGMKTGVYCCSNENCVDYIDHVSSLKRSNNLTDAVVFDDYQEDCADSEEYIAEVANIAHLFLPTVEVEDMGDFRKELIEDSGKKFKAGDVRVIYLNSIPYILAPNHSDYEDEIEELVEDMDEGDEFEDFKDDVYDIIDEDECQVYDIYAALLYIKGHIELSDTEDINLFEVLTFGSKSDFVSFLESIDSIDEDEYDEIWDVIKPLAKSKSDDDDDEDED